MKKIINVGCDLDGCVFDFSDNFRKSMLKYYSTVALSRDQKKCRELLMAFIDEHTKECFELPIYSDCDKVLSKLNKMGKKITFITARGTHNKGKVLKEIKQITKNSLNKKMKFPYKLKYSDEKFLFAKNKKIDIMIEDDIDNAIAMSEFCPVIFFPRPWNYGEKIINKNIIPVTNWREVLFLLENWELIYYE
jgi:uncharacterized HAD superfamily protein